MKGKKIQPLQGWVHSTLWVHFSWMVPGRISEMLTHRVVLLGLQAEMEGPQLEAELYAVWVDDRNMILS